MIVTCYIQVILYQYGLFGKLYRIVVGAPVCL